MARPEGFEPPTPRFVVWCSIQLSYGRLLDDGKGVPARQRRRLAGFGQPDKSETGGWQGDRVKEAGDNGLKC